MGKVDDQRAMREARYAARQRPARQPGASPVAAGEGATPPAPRRVAKKVSALKVVREGDVAALTTGAEPAAADDAAAPELCGHRSIGNKSCTREKDHQATGTKNHRYS